MADNVTNDLIYETLTRMQETLGTHTRYYQEARDRLGTLEQQYCQHFAPGRPDRQVAGTDRAASGPDRNAGRKVVI